MIDVDAIIGDERETGNQSSESDEEESVDDKQDKGLYLPNIHTTNVNGLNTEDANEEIEKKNSSQTMDLNETKKNLSHQAIKNEGTKKGVIQNEVKIKGKVKLREFFSFSRYGIGIIGVIFSIIFSLLSSCCFISVNLTVGQWTSDDQDDKSLWYSLFIISVCLYILVSFLRGLAVVVTSLSSSHKLHFKMVWKLLRAKIVLFDSNPIGTILTRFAKDLAMTDQFLPKMINYLLITFTKCFILLVFIIIIVPWNLVILLLVLIPMYMIRRWTIIAQNDTKRFDAMSKGPLNTRYSSALDGITSIRAYRRFCIIEGFMKDSDLNASAKFTYASVLRWSGSRIDLCACLFVAGNLFMVSILTAFFDVFDKKLAALTVQFSLEFAVNATVAIRSYGEIENMFTCVQRMMEYANMESEDELTKQNDPKDFSETADIFFSDVHMRYQPHLPKILKGLTYHVKDGEKIGIIGRTGAGKSSIVQTIFRLVETEPGSQIVIGGEDIKDIGIHCLRNAISFIPQSPFLISSTIRANLDPFEVYSDEQVWRALEEVQLKNYVQSLNDGLATEVTDQNIFSVGQKQLICLARAILRNTKILVLDEATANVDIETDSLIQRAIREKFKDCTVLTIAHRIATISDSDQILVMDDGKIIKHGKPDEILYKFSRREENLNK